MSDQTPQQPGWGPPPTPPPQPGWGPGAPAPAPRKRHPVRSSLIAIGALAVLVVVLSVVSSHIGTSSSSDGATTATTAADNGISRGLGSADASGDVVIDDNSVTVDTIDEGSGLLKATLTITNHSSRRSDYFIQATLLNSAGENVGTANAVAQGVDPNQVAHTDLSGSYTGKVDTVKITQVQRTESV